jgi:transposase
MRSAGVEPHLAEPADTSALRGPKRRAKTDKADAKLLRDLLAAGRIPECYIPPSQVLEWRALLELYHDLRCEHAGWAQRIHATCFHQGTTQLGEGRRDPRLP